MIEKLCLDCRWVVESGAPQIHWQRVPAPPGEPDQAGPLLRFYVEGSKLAGAGEMQAAFDTFTQGLDAYRELVEKNPHHDTLYRSLVWGQAAVFVAVQRFPEAWQLLMEVFGPDTPGRALPLELTLNWCQSLTASGISLGQWPVVFATLNMLHQLRWSGAFLGEEQRRQMPRLEGFLQSRWEGLEHFRLDCFESMMRAGDFEVAEALAIAASDLMTLNADLDGQVMWRDFAGMARQRRGDFELDAVCQRLLTTDPEAATYYLAKKPQPEDLDIWLRLCWAQGKDGEPLLQWQPASSIFGGEGPRNAADSSLFQMSELAADKASEGDLTAAARLYQQGLQAFESLSSPQPVDLFVWCYMLWGLAVTLDRMGRRQQAWEVITPAMGSQTEQLAKPISYVMQWVGSSVIIGAGCAQWDEVAALFDFLGQLQRHILTKQPKTGEEQHYLMQVCGQVEGAMAGLLDGSYRVYLETSPATAPEWVRRLQLLLEPDGRPCKPLRRLMESV